MRLVKSLVRACTRARELATAKHARSGAPVIARRPSGIFEVEDHSSLPHLLYATRRWNPLTAHRVLVPSVLPLCVVVLASVSLGDANGVSQLISTRPPPRTHLWTDPTQHSPHHQGARSLSTYIGPLFLIYPYFVFLDPGHLHIYVLHVWSYPAATMRKSRL